MRIRDLHIEGFGRFAAWRRGPFERPVTLFRGDNEAGKSTLLEFIRRLLFGFPDGRRRSNPYPPLAGGNHGGRLTLVGKAGEAVVVKRFRDAQGGQPTLFGPNGVEMPNSELQRLLGHHSQAVFQSIFAFTLDELQDAASLNDEQVNRQIYSAGMGAANLPEALTRLEEEKRALFLKGGTRNKILQTAQELGSVDTRLNEVVDNAQNYRCLSAKLGDIKAQLEELNGCDQNIRSQLAQQNRLENAWPSWYALNEVERQLSSVPAIDNFPADGVSRLGVLEDRIHTAQQECDSSENAVATTENQAEVTIEHEPILNYTDEIRRLEQGLTSFTNDIHDLPLRQAELGQQEHALTETLGELGADWNEDRLKNFDLSLVVREEILQQANGLREAEERLQECRTKLGQDQQFLEEAIAAQQGAQNSLEAAPSPDIDQKQIGRRRTTLRQMRSCLREIDSIQAQLDSIKKAAMPNNGQRGSFAFSISGFFVGLAFLASSAAPVGDEARFMGMAAGIALIGMAAYLFVSRRSLLKRQEESPLADAIRESLHKAEAELERLGSEFAQEAEAFQLDVIDEAWLQAAEDLLVQAEAQLIDRASRADALDQATRLVKGRQNRQQQSKQAVKQAKKDLQTSEVEWRDWLAERGLPEGLSPVTIGELRGKVELGRTQLRTLQNNRERTNAMQGSIDEYVVAVRRLAVNFGLAIDRDDFHTTATAVHRLAELRIEVERQVGERRNAKEQLRNARHQLQNRKQYLQKLEREKQDLLQLGGASDTETFRQRAEQDRLRLELEQRKSEALGSLQLLSGPGQPLEDLKQKLAATDMQAIQEQKSRLDQRSQEVSEQISSLREKLVLTQEQRSQLIGEEESSKLRTERHRLVESMRGHARAWAVRTVAENLLKEAQAKFERERQPAVLRDAQEFFRSITDGRYQTMFSPLGSSEIKVTDSDESVKKPNQLSRGTREQLFLSLRFGLIRELGRRSEPQPVILDDALVNFDPRRGKKAAEVFLGLAETNQVLVFTCHPQIVEWFVEAAESNDAELPEIIDLN